MLGKWGQITCNILENDRNACIEVVGFIDDNKSLIGKRLAGKPIYSETYAFNKVLKERDVHEIIFAINNNGIKVARKKKLFDHCVKEAIHIREVPPIKDWIDGQFSSQQIRDIKIEDLLGREPIWLDQETGC